MQLTIHGAAREVTGSCHLLAADNARVLLDCGMIQGGKERHERNRAPFPFDPAEIDCVVLSHAHIDHSGRLPLLVRRGFRGRVLATPPTIHLARILLADSGRLHEEDAHWKRRRLRRRGEDDSWVQPLYTERDALAVSDRFEPLAFDAWRAIPGLGRVRLRMAGHILGAAIVELVWRAGGEDRCLVFSGDLGARGARLMSAPQRPTSPEYLLMESTYGDRDHDEEDRTEALRRVIVDTAEAGGRVLIPAFAVGRTQEVLARINDLAETGRIPRVPVFVDSPMAVEATRVFARFPEAWSTRARRRDRAGDRPLEFEGLRLVTRVEESKELNSLNGPMVIISASGMLTGGRVKHHLRRSIGDPASTLAFVGYQAQGTLGRLLQEGVDPIRIFGERYRVRMRIETLGGFSAHADRRELLDWFDGIGRVPRRTFLVHGEPEASEILAAELGRRFDADVVVPELGQIFALE